MKFYFNPQEVEVKIKSLSKLSTTPEIAFKIMQLLEGPQTPVSKLTSLISSDQILTARVLKLANDRNFEYPGQISTINLALVIIGFKSLKKLVFSMAATDLFKRHHHVVQTDAAKLLQHSIRVGCGAKILAEMTSYPIPGEAFVAGLLHNVGQHILLQQYPDIFEQAVSNAQHLEMSLTESENDLLGMDHRQLAIWLAESWNFPLKFIRVLKDYRNPGFAQRDKDLIYMVHLANLICHTLEGEQNHNFLGRVDEKETLRSLKRYFHRECRSLEFYQEKFLTGEREFFEGQTQPHLTMINA